MLRRLTLSVLLAAALLGACKDDSGNGAATSSSSSVSSSSSSSATSISRPPGSAVQPTSTTVKATDFAFDPKALTLKAGAPTAIRVANVGQASHTFTVDELKVDQQVPPGQEAQVLVQAPPAGTYTFYCRFHRGQGMVGTLLVQ